MSALVISASSLSTSLSRYWRSWSLWLLLLVAPLGAKYMIHTDDGAGVLIAIDGYLPEMTSAFLGVSLGIVVSTLLLPVGWLYLRSNTTRRQPWQVEEVSAASRIAIALGRFSADAIILLTMLAALTLAGFFLGWLLLPASELNFAHISFALWLVAAPALIGLAALRTFFDARPLLRSGFGDFAYFVLWIMSIAMPAATEGRPASFASNMFDFAGFAAPLRHGATTGGDSFAISIGGGYEVAAERMPLDVIAGLTSPGYIDSRFAWIGVAIALVVIAGLIYQPHRPRRRSVVSGRLGALLNAGPPPRAHASARPASQSWAGALDLIIAEFRLIGAGRAFSILAAAIAALSAFVDFRHLASPAALLLLIFAVSAHAGRSEARGLLALTKVSPVAAMTRRGAFIAAGGLWTTVLALPALVRAPALETLTLASATGAVTAAIAITLGTLTGSAFAARLVLFVLWYGYVSS